MNSGTVYSLGSSQEFVSFVGMATNSMGSYISISIQILPRIFILSMVFFVGYKLENIGKNAVYGFKGNKTGTDELYSVKHKK